MDNTNKDNVKELLNENICLICKKREIEYSCLPCLHSYLCKLDAMKLSTGGKCKVKWTFIYNKNIN